MVFLRNYTALVLVLLAPTGWSDPVFLCEFRKLGRQARFMITGPTTVGKTSVVEKLAVDIDGHVVNADKMYFYSGDFKIGAGLTSAFDSTDPRKHLYQILAPSDLLAPQEYAAKVEGVLKKIGPSTPVIFDGASKNYLSPLDDVAPGLVKIGLRWPEGYDLRGAIDRRIEKALEGGLVAETKKLMDQGLESTPPFQESPVYQIVARHLKGEIDLPRMKKELADAGENIARSQYRSLRRLTGVIWIDSDPRTPEKTVEAIKAILSSPGTHERGTFTTASGKRITLHAVEHDQLAALKGPVAEGYALAARRYKETYTEHAGYVDKYFENEFERMKPQRSGYFTVAAKDGHGVSGFGMMYDGSGGKTIGELPIENQFPQLNMRLTVDGKPTDNVSEVLRLSTEKGEASLSDLLQGAAATLHLKHGAENIPEDLTVVGVVENAALVKLYQAAGFSVRYSPKATGRRDRWVLQMGGKPFMERYGSAAIASSSAE